VAAVNTANASTAPTTSTTSSSADSTGSVAATRSFTLWALETLRLQVEREDEHVYRFIAPEERRGSLNGAGSVRFTFADAHGTARAVGPLERVTPQSRMFQWILDELRAYPQPLQAFVKDDVRGASELEESFRAAYKLQGVTLHLSDAKLESRPVLRMAVRLAARGPQNGSRLQHWHFLPDGTPIDDQRALELGLDQPQSANGSAPVFQGDLDAWLEAAAATVRRRNPDLPAAPPELPAELPESSAEAGESVASCLVWCRHVSGKLVFACGGSTVELPFAGWARRFRSGHELPPPFHCPLTGLESYEVEASDDGQITVSEALETCGHSARRVLAGQLEACQATGTRVLPEYLVACPVSGRRLLASRLVECRDCRQAVDPDGLQQTRCGACRKLVSVSKDDPRMALVLGEYPKLERWSRWRMSETGSVYVLTANDWFRRMLVVLQKESLEVRHLATSGRVRPAWMEVPPQQRAEFFD
jgi:hypothetical protein